MLAFLNANKTKITGALLTTLAFVQTNSALGSLLSPTTYAWTMFFVGLFVTFLGFLNNPAPADGSVSKPGGFARISFMIFLGAIIMAISLSSCTSNPVKEAESFEQKSFALYGTYVIFQSKAAELAQESTTPANVRDALKAADSVAYPVAEALVDAAIEVGAIRAVLNACPTLPEPDPTCVPTNELRLTNAVTNLSSIYFSAQPKLLALVAAVKEAK